MTTQTTIADSDPASTAQESTESLTDAATTPDASEAAETSSGKGNAEAARYRRQLRDTEAELDVLTSKIEAYERREVERLAGDLSQPSDLFDIAGVTVADLLDDGGNVDPEAVAAKVAELLESRPGLAAGSRRPAAPAYPNYGQGAAPFSGRGGASHSWHAALKRG